MNDHSNGNSPSNKENEIETAQLRSLTADYVFCPKCGAENAFNLSRAGKQLNYFCKRCSIKLNNYWTEFQNGQQLLANCKNCQQLTFESAKYCIYCGLIHKSKAKIKPETKTEDVEIEPESTLDFYSTYDRDEEKIVTSIISKNEYLRWRRMTYTSKKVSVIGTSILNVFLIIGSVFVYLEMNNYLTIAFFSCAFVCLIVTGAFIVNYEEKMKISEKIDSKRLAKERKPMSWMIIFPLSILTGAVLTLLVLALIQRYWELIRC
ncbi:MAG: zinc ribbon domain-containing protein [Asgard group archaeon]|nr:zinc ribbon domain-containing protein [Asgard group archaeon]